MANPIYKVIFLNQNQVFELYARAIYQSEMYGFIEVEEFVFGEKAQLVVDPSEEKLKNEFSGVSRTLVPVHAVIRVDEVKKRGQSKIMELGKETNITPFPSSLYTPGKHSEN